MSESITIVKEPDSTRFLSFSKTTESQLRSMLLSGEIFYIQEKLDGSNARLTFDAEKQELGIGSRTQDVGTQFDDNDRVFHGIASIKQHLIKSTYKFANISGFSKFTIYCELLGYSYNGKAIIPRSDYYKYDPSKKEQKFKTVFVYAVKHKEDYVVFTDVQQMLQDAGFDIIPARIINPTEMIVYKSEIFPDSILEGFVITSTTNKRWKLLNPDFNPQDVSSTNPSFLGSINTHNFQNFLSKDKFSSDVTKEYMSERCIKLFVHELVSDWTSPINVSPEKVVEAVVNCISGYFKPLKFGKNQKLDLKENRDLIEDVLNILHPPQPSEN